MNDNLQPTPPPADSSPAAAAPAPSLPQGETVLMAPRKRSLFGRVLSALGLLVVFGSISLNVTLIGIIASQAMARHRRGMATKVVRAGQRDQTVAVYHLQSVIHPGAVEAFQKFFDEVIKDDNVKAVVVRVVSPGGSVTSSNQIRRMVRQLKEAGKTVVVSMGGMAASGGYYISAPAHEIIAEPTTITGSIGVLMTYFVLEGTLEEIGIEPVVIKSTHADLWKDAGSPLRQITPREREHLLAILDTYQEQFERVVRDGRGKRLKTKTTTHSMTVGEGDNARVVKVTETAPFNGKAYLAADAQALGLIDGIGYRADAIARAAELANLDDRHVLQFLARRSPLQQLLDAKSSSALHLGPELLDRLQTPRFEMIWKAD